MAVSEQTYLQLVLEEDDEKWELVNGCLRRKPPMTWEHGHTARLLTRMLDRQLDPDEYEVVHDSGRLRYTERNYFIPDVYVVPMAMVRRLFTRPGMVEAYPEPLPLVVEVWSPSTGDYDVTGKLTEYRRRGDLDLWLIHPYERTLTAWRRGPDGAYEQTRYGGGTVTPVHLPAVTIELEQLFR